MANAKLFQSTLPREERLSLSRLIPTHSNFNPRFHERSDVSGGNGSGSGSDFNPRFHERSYGYHIRIIHNGDYFNPRFHERSDSLLFNIPEDVVISIHASTRGATLMFGFLTPYFIFQSTLPREERPSSSCVVHPTTLFQSTLPREERPIRCRFLHAIENFNPRFHERSDNQP